MQYYTAEPQESREGDRVVYISSADQYNGLYGQPSGSSRSSHGNFIQPSRSSVSESKSRSKEAKTPPVQTIRNYNKVNDDGSFTFGYEAADGSFKEETRGTDCVVRGKYGYVDPDGNKREFTYVSGNPCDPNAPNQEEEEVKEQEADSGPANYPTKPIKPVRPKPPVTLFENNFGDDEEVDDQQGENEQIYRPQSIQVKSIPQHINLPFVPNL